MLHGLAVRDDMMKLSWSNLRLLPLSCMILLPWLKLPWGNIPQHLKANGSLIYFGDLTGWGSYRSNANLLVSKVYNVLAETNADKVNIIAHSKGGIDARYAISKLKIGEKVASLTTISTPHRGSCIADIATRLIPEDNHIIEQIIRLLAWLTGDPEPAGTQAIQELTREHMSIFNQDVPDYPGTYYQSYGSIMQDKLNDMFFMLNYNLLLKIEGDNDGMVSVLSSKWGDFQETFTGTTDNVGISHLQITGSARDTISEINIPEIYIDIVKRIKNMGY